MPDDPYAVLELRSDASDSEVKAAYRRLAALYHPDRNPGFQAAATERLKQLNHAYSRVIALRRQQPADDGSRTASHRPGQQEEKGDPRSHTGARGRTDWQREDPAGRAPTRRESIAATLLRNGYLSSDVAVDDEVVVDVLATMLPPGSDIIVCADYVDAGPTLTYPHREESGRFLRPLSISLGASLGGVGLGSARRPPATRVVLCTNEILMWTTSEFHDSDGVVIEESVTGHAIPLADILGATPRKRGRVDIWIDEGPTLTFRTTPEAAAKLGLSVDAAASV